MTPEEGTIVNEECVISDPVLDEQVFLELEVRGGHSQKLKASRWKCRFMLAEIWGSSTKCHSSQSPNRQDRAANRIT